MKCSRNFLIQSMVFTIFHRGWGPDLPRLRMAMDGVDFVIHAAALKQLAGEYNPLEAVKTNVIGSQNVIDSAISAGVKRNFGFSTDKAAAPINLYGATKLTSDKLYRCKQLRGRSPYQIFCGPLQRNGQPRFGDSLFSGTSKTGCTTHHG